MMKNGLYTFVTAALLGAALTSCNSNDDAGAQAIEIPGITIEADADCCTAALRPAWTWRHWPAASSG